MTDNGLQKRYTGKGAEKYDDKRRLTPRFLAEEKAFSAYFEKVKPDRVLDCPFGTGRWLDYYKTISGPVIGFDLSSDMLDEARKKIGADESVNIRFITGSVFDFDFSEFTAENLNLLVCTRFLNWFDLKKAVEAISNLSKAPAQWAIIGASVRPSELSLVSRIRMMLRLRSENQPRREKNLPPQYVHDEKHILSAFRANGWRVVEKTHIFSSPTRENYFWLLKRDI